MGSADWQETLVAEGDRYEDLGTWSDKHARGGEVRAGRGVLAQLGRSLPWRCVAMCVRLALMFQKVEVGGEPEGRAGTLWKSCRTVKYLLFALPRRRGTISR